MTLTHEEARRALQAAADGLLSTEGRAALEAHLQTCAACRDEAEALSALEKRLSASLQTRWPLYQLPSPPAASFLGPLIHPRRPVMQTSTPLLRPLVIGVAAILLVIVIGLGIRAFAPPQIASLQSPTVLPAVSLASTPGPTSPPAPTPIPSDWPTYIVARGDTCISIAANFGVPVQLVIERNNLSADCQIAVGQRLIIPRATPTPVGSLPQPTGIFPNLAFEVATTWPDAPAQVSLYRQQLSPGVTAQTAQQVAASLGVAGVPAPVASEGFGQTIFEVSDGTNLLRFINFPNQWVYDPMLPASPSSGEWPPFDQQVAIAETFLNARSLLDTPYRVEPIENQPGGVRFVQLLDDRPVRYGIGVNGDFNWIDVTITRQGQVGQVMYSAHDFQPAGDYPILSAQQAWQRLASEQGLGRSQFAIFPPEQTARIWERPYPLGRETEFYGLVYASESGDGLLFSLWGASSAWKLSGSLQGLEGQVSSGYKQWNMTRIWGQLSEIDGERLLNVNRWEASSVAGDFHFGRIERRGNQGWLVAEDGQNFLLPDLPPTVPDGALVNVSGVVVAGEPLIYEWSSLDTLITSYGVSQSCFSGGGSSGGGPSNANFGGGAFAPLGLGNAPQPTPVPPASPVQPGETIEGLTGTVYVTIYTRMGVETRRQVALGVEPGEFSPDYLSLQLEGDALAGIEALNSLPVKIWGRVSRIAEDGTPVVAVERFEEAYPGLRIQVWIGTESVVTLDGKTAILFTTQDGLQFVLKHTIGGDASYLVGRAGDTIIQEGILIPGETFGGYPVMVDLAASLGGDQDLSNYEITSSQVTVIDEADMMGSASMADSLHGVATIESIELAYAAISLDNCRPADNETSLEAGLYVQPIWVFKGHLADGRRFEIRIQALPDEYLQLH